MIADPTDAFCLPQSHSWAAVSNDSILSRRDDFLTAEGAVHLTGDGWTATSDFQMMTLSKPGWRTDQIGATVGHSHTIGAVYLDGEIGLLTDGKLGGNKMQNRYHASRGIHPVPALYVERQRHAPLATIEAAWTVEAIQVRGVVSGTGRVIHALPALAIGGDHACLSVGYLTSWGREPSFVADAVDVNQRGMQLSIGFMFDHVATSAEISGRAVMWSVGIVL